MEITTPDAKEGIPDAQNQNDYALRRERLRKKIIESGLDMLLVSSAPNRFYLSGFELHDPQPNESAGLLLLTASGEDWLLTDSRYALAAEKLWPVERICVYTRQEKAVAELFIRHGNLAGLESAALSWDFVRHLKQLLGNRVFIHSANELVEELRVIKDKSEINALRQSFKLNHQMFDWLDKKISAGFDDQTMTEVELAWEIERLFHEQGAQELAFSTIAATGKNSAKPHAIPGRDNIACGHVLLVDAGCRVNNYCSDQTRSWWIGPDPSEDFHKTMTLVRNAQKAAFAVMRPGISCAEVYAAARKVFEEAGVASAFTHGLGHGVGLETHEAPRLSARSTDILEEGMVVTVEPGLYFPEWGGIRWENTVLVTNSGMEIL